MKTLVLRGLGFALMIHIMLQCGPLISAAATNMFSKFEEMANSIIYYDENGNVQMNGEFAERTLDQLGEHAQTVTEIVGSRAESILGSVAANTENSEDTSAELEHLEEAALEELNKINELGEMLMN